MNNERGFMRLTRMTDGGKGKPESTETNAKREKNSNESLFSFPTFNLLSKKKKKTLPETQHRRRERAALAARCLCTFVTSKSFFISLCTQPKALNICARYLGWDPCFYIILLTFIRPTN